MTGVVVNVWSCRYYSDRVEPAGSGVGSLLVSPPASDADARREFSTDEKTALLGRLPQTREALQPLRSSVWHTDTQTIAE